MTLFRKMLKYDTFCRETLKYGTFCQKILITQDAPDCTYPFLTLGKCLLFGKISTLEAWRVFFMTWVLEPSPF